jgi:DNA-binding MarR family transcriptional regulator
MELPANLEVLHQPVRLRLMALLFQRGDVGFAAARDALELTPGNLDGHAKRLAEAGFLELRRALLRTGFETRYRITRSGREAFEAYLDWLAAFIASTRPPP